MKARDIYIPAWMVDDPMFRERLGDAIYILGESRIAAVILALQKASKRVRRPAKQKTKKKT